MPALVLFKRRWKLASDDLVIPASILAVIHFIWTSILMYALVATKSPSSDFFDRIGALKLFVIGLAIIFPVNSVLEVIIAIVSTRGGPLKINMRISVTVLLYARLGVLGIELFWEIFSMVWLLLSGDDKPSIMVIGLICGFLLFNWLITFAVIGQFGKAPPMIDNLKRSGVNSITQQHSFSQTNGEEVGKTLGDGSGIYSSINEALYKGGIMSNSLTGRLNVDGADDNVGDVDKGYIGSHEICCFSEPYKRNSYRQLENVVSFMFGDLDLVQSDVTAGLVLLKRSQRLRQEMTIAEPSNEVYQFLSGTPVTTTTRFLGFKSQATLEFYSKVVRYMRYPLATHRLTKRKLFKKFKRERDDDDDDGGGDDDTGGICACCHNKPKSKNSQRLSSGKIRTTQSEPVENELANLIGRKHFELLYCSLLNVEMDGMSFLVGLDHEFHAVVICVWSVICLKDIFVKMCSVKATSQCVVVRPDWLVSEYFALVAEKICSKLRNDNLLPRALNHDQSSKTEYYQLIVTGQSLAGGVACVLAILLRQFYHNLHCFAYAPPNSIFSASCVRDTQSFITTVVVGKDTVPRLGCNQIEAFRQNMVSCLRSCDTPKMKILCSQRPSSCCPVTGLAQTSEYLGEERNIFDRCVGLNLPGKVVHIVRSRPKTSCSNRMSHCKRHSVFQAVWARNEDFKNILVSRNMISDHCPYVIMDALEKVLTHISPAKPVRKGIGRSGRRAHHHRPIISANSSHNETTLTSQNTVSDFSTSEQLIESTYAPAALSVAPPTDIVRPPIQEFFSQSINLVGNYSEAHFESDGSTPYEKVNNQTFPKVKMRSSRPSEFVNRAIRITPQQLSSNCIPFIQQNTESFYNTIPNHFPSNTTNDNGSTTHPTDDNRNATFFVGEQNSKRQPIFIDNWTGAFAPLASPEALSESSSLASCGESSSSGNPIGFLSGIPGQRGDSIKRLSSGAAYQRLVARIDPIRQSPLGPVHPFSGSWSNCGSVDADGSHKDLPERIKKSSLASKSTTSSLKSRSTTQEQGSVKEEEEQTKDLRDFGAFLSHDPNSKESYYAEIGELSDTLTRAPQATLGHRAGPKSDSLYDLIFDSSPTENHMANDELECNNDKPKPVDSDLMVFSPPSSEQHFKTKSIAIVLPSTDVSRDLTPTSKQGQQTPPEILEREPIYSKVIPKLERKPEAENVPREFLGPVASELFLEAEKVEEIEDVMTSGDIFPVDSDEDYEEAQEQFIYDLMIGHYSCAGRGYPHGFVESYSKKTFDRTAHFSVAEEVIDPTSADIF